MLKTMDGKRMGRGNELQESHHLSSDVGGNSATAWSPSSDYYPLPPSQFLEFLGLLCASDHNGRFMYAKGIYEALCVRKKKPQKHETASQCRIMSRSSESNH